MKQVQTSNILLACGILIAPVFYLSVTIQMLTREGFDITRHPLSLLSLGDLGWIQITTFLLAGLLAIVCAGGIRLKLVNRPGRLWGPLLIAAYGVGMMIAGLSPPDPLLGFPPGAGARIPDHMSTHAIFHGIGFFIAFASLISACFMFGQLLYLEGRTSWSLYSYATGAATLGLIVTGMSIQSATGIAFYTVGIVAFGWLGAIAACLIFDPITEPVTQGA
jgi:Protein of unknown function (DUF998)